MRWICWRRRPRWIRPAALPPVWLEHLTTTNTTRSCVSTATRTHCSYQEKSSKHCSYCHCSVLVRVRPSRPAVFVTQQWLLLETNGARGIHFTTRVGFFLKPPTPKSHTKADFVSLTPKHVCNGVQTASRGQIIRLSGMKADWWSTLRDVF